MSNAQKQHPSSLRRQQWNLHQNNIFNIHKEVFPAPSSLKVFKSGISAKSMVFLGIPGPLVPPKNAPKEKRIRMRIWTILISNRNWLKLSFPHKLDFALNISPHKLDFALNTSHCSSFLVCSAFLWSSYHSVTVLCNEVAFLFFLRSSLLNARFTAFYKSRL